jgi:glutathione S-transferase
VDLWHIELSHYSEKARWALDLKGVAYRLRTPLPGLHGPVAMALTRSGHRRLPVLRLDGATIAGSAAIIAALDERFPEPRLVPGEPAARAQALEHQAWFDEHLGPAVRAYCWSHILGSGANLADAIAPNAAPGRRRVFAIATPLARPFVRADYGATPARATAERATILDAADRVEAALSPSGYLVGDTFSVADLAGAALFTPLLCPPRRPYPPAIDPLGIIELRAELEGREAGRWVAEMYARHRVPAAAVQAA